MLAKANIGRETRQTRTVPLVQVPRPHRFSYWRTGVLLGVHVLMIAHVLHWWSTGSSMSRFVLSDSMRTLELGEINPGAVLFAAALLVTLVFGRFMCGWVCHMGALQDFTAWVLRRLGRRPHIFRARLLGYVPLGLAVYMFVWPTAAREVLAPLARETWPQSRLGAVAAFPGWSASWTTGALWEGLPGWWVAIPFLLVSGTATVWFLGARGLCRFACPYGGFLLPASAVAPVRVRVEASKCDQCGKCTAACTAGVRVLDNLLATGSVTDTNCIRSLDCVAACPNGALSLRAGRSRPMEGHRSPRSTTPYDVTWGEELWVLAIFLGTFFVSRGLYDGVPMLMAASLGVVAGYAGWKALCLVRHQHVRFAGVVAKTHGRLTPAGLGLALLLAAAALLGAHSCVVRGLLIAAAREDDKVRVTFAQAIGEGGADEDQRRAAADGLRLYRLAGPIAQGGLGLARTPQAQERAAWLMLVLGDRDGAVNMLLDLAHSGRSHETQVLSTADLMLTLGRDADTRGLLEWYVKSRPGASRVRCALARLRAMAGDITGAERLLDARVEVAPHDAAVLADRGQLRILNGRAEAGLADLRLASDLLPHDAYLRLILASGLAMTGAEHEARDVLIDGASRIPGARDMLKDAADRLVRAGPSAGQADAPR